MAVTVDFLRKGLKINHLRLVSALARFGSVSEAAEHLGMSQPAASRLAGEIEKITGTPIHERTGRGIGLTPAGRLLAHRAARILNEISDAGREIHEAREGITGYVRIGSVTGPSIDYVVPATRQLRLSYPAISVEVMVAASDVLLPQLLEGALDFALCRITGAAAVGDLEAVPLCDEPLSFVVRTGHPLTRTGRPVELAAMAQFDWILPPPGAILRSTVEREFISNGVAMPRHVLTTTSFLYTLAAVRLTNAVAPIASAVARSFASDQGGSSGLMILNAETVLAVETWSLLTRRGQELTPSARMVREHVLAAVGRG
ncbi:LysR family transcriptional regulator [Hoeflea sp.]|uniref:LysR family transcriptional regulator n=1 Tax=Hoeflea sp. TaxID=1940281 RepID=UPI003BAF4F72